MGSHVDAQGSLEAKDLASLVAAAQAVYYVPTGLWPIFHIRSFEWVTGPKVDRWLVKTVSALVLAIGAGLGLAARRRNVTPELALIGAGSAIGLATVDVVYVARRRISRVYLLDAIGELAICAGWLMSAPRRER
ncbi:MAG: hypothetical protein QOF73_2911 [Thermomicrobiales bacterium]|nr:hypothetical protein [Thermomicrobiales bacterium]